MTVVNSTVLIHPSSSFTIKSKCLFLWPTRMRLTTKGRAVAQVHKRH
jgi:hypothetical protein